MEEKQVLVKTIKKSFDSNIKAGITWFKFISAINDINLTKRELELLAFINYRGTISSSSSKEEYCKLFESSKATVANMIARLSKLKLIVKEKTINRVNSKVKINPSLYMDFTKDVVIRLFIDVNIDKPSNNNDTD